MEMFKPHGTVLSIEVSQRSETGLNWGCGLPWKRPRVDLHNHEIPSTCGCAKRTWQRSSKISSPGSPSSQTRVRCGPRTR
ncbi:hypothetical protein ACE6H2_008100 [Prunus campanulata]